MGVDLEEQVMPIVEKGTPATSGFLAPHPQRVLEIYGTRGQHPALLQGWFLSVIPSL